MRLESPKKCNDDLYHRIVMDVMCGRIRPKERLGENSLSSRLGSPRGAIREALTRLEQDGLVVRKDNVGTYFREIEDDELLEIYDVRIAIEPLVAMRVAAIASEHELDDLAGLAKQIDLAPSSDINRDVLDNDFHLKLAEISKMKHIPRLMVIGNLHARCSLLHQQLVLFKVQSAKPIARPDHRDIVKALRSRNQEKASSTMAEHLRIAKELAVAEIERVNSFVATMERQ
jgi:DNA-binding GntR family transcriptional regulator